MFRITALEATPDNVNTETLAATKTLVTTDRKIQKLDPDGSGRDLVLPAESLSFGLVYYIKNTANGAEVITIKNDGGDTICTPTQNEGALVFCDGETWEGMVFAIN